MSPIFTVFWLSLITVLATGLGAIPFFFVKHISKHVSGIFHAVAAGLMLGATVQLILEGLHDGWIQIIIGILAGVALIYVSGRILSGNSFSFTDVVSKKPNHNRLIFLIGILFVHSFAEGVSIGVSFGETLAFGLLISISLAIHNIPEGLAISLALFAKGYSPWHCMWWSIFSSIPQVLAAVPAFLFVEAFHPILPYGLGFAAGAMGWIIFADLIPEAREELPSAQALGITALSAFALLAIGFLI